MNTFIAQVGGDHYKPTQDGGMQHWDLMEKYDIAYLEATGTKYVQRVDKHGTPAEDLDKAISYFKKLKACRNDGTRRLVPLAALEAYLAQHELSPELSSVFYDVLVDGSRAAIANAIELCENLRGQYPA